MDHEVSCSIVPSDVAEFDLEAYDKQVLTEKEETMDSSATPDEKSVSGEWNIIPESQQRMSTKEI